MEMELRGGMPVEDEGGRSAHVLDELFEQLTNGLDSLDALQAEGYDQTYRSNLITDIRTTVQTLRDSLGECQMAVPYSSMRPVRRPDGTTVWCCNHLPEHC